ncbi:hypothetical protein ERICIV_04353 [Paenibacillus larvae subsp. larvae]|uniref:Uncharacterized protein n=1 Tax=Paenibacillus larvae subsp. larvae TaxID=147375 RepID=A0A2L1U6R5_9BACL|nr:hypothetical protein ERICIII_04608 [Paenibacillus larvae subsp. larvae]AVF33124.1 hypothetical protein ERICIV_04353 [Paenibacillus larvae subsp. larvae]
MPIDFHSDSNRYSYAGRTASLEWRRVHSIPTLSVFLPNVLYAIPVFGRCTFVEPFKLFREV